MFSPKFDESIETNNFKPQFMIDFHTKTKTVFYYELFFITFVQFTIYKSFRQSFGGVTMPPAVNQRRLNAF